jgi:hypothetical protein
LRSFLIVPHVSFRLTLKCHSGIRLYLILTYLKLFYFLNHLCLNVSKYLLKFLTSSLFVHLNIFL